MQLILGVTDKKLSVFRVTQAYLNLLVKPRLFSKFSRKYIFFCIFKGIFNVYDLMHFERQHAFKNAENYIFFFRKKYVCYST